MPSTKPFLSYASTDRAQAARLVDLLQRYGHDVQWDQRLLAGRPWLDQLEALSVASDACLLLVGTRGVDRFVKAECMLAINRHFGGSAHYPVVPVLLPGIEASHLPPFLSLFQSLRFEELFSAGGAHALDSALAAVGTGDPIAALPWQEHCPYPGFVSFDESRKGYFIGRERESLAVLALLGMSGEQRDRRWVNVQGTSGVGKSSLVRAGVIPAIRSGWVVDTEQPAQLTWLVLSCGRAPRRWRISG